jgi:hypothetical protein
MYHPPSSITLILNTFDTHGISIGDLVLELLSGKYNEHPALESILGNLEQILDSLSTQDEGSQQKILKWSSRRVTDVLRDEMCKLTLKETGFHFSARKTTDAKLKEFDIQEMSNKIEDLAPGLSKLFNVLLEADPMVNYKRNWARQKVKATGTVGSKKSRTKVADGDIDMADVEDAPAEEEELEYWDLFDLEEVPLVEKDDDEPEGIDDEARDQFVKLKTIVSSNSLGLREAHTYHLFAETRRLSQYSDAEYKSVMQCTSECSGHFLTLLRYA